MRYKHYAFGRHGYINLYFNVLRCKRSVEILHYRNPTIYVLVIQCRRWGG